MRRSKYDLANKGGDGRGRAGSSSLIHTRAEERRLERSLREIDRSCGGCQTSKVSIGLLA